MSIYSEVMLAPEVEDDPSGFIDTLITQATAIIQGYTKNEDWPDTSGAEDTVLDGACVRLVLFLYRNAGAEGSESISFGDMRRGNFEIPPEVKIILDSKRRCGWF
jgi:hypothetical protein